MLLNLKDVKLTKADEKRLRPLMSNWNRFHKANKKKPFSVEDLLKVLKLEAVHRRGSTSFGLRVLGIYHRLATTLNTEAVYKVLAAGKK